MQKDKDEYGNLWEVLDAIKRKRKQSSTEKRVILLFDAFALTVGFIGAPLLVALPLSHTFHLGNVGILLIWTATLVLIHFAGKGIKIKMPHN